MASTFVFQGVSAVTDDIQTMLGKLNIQQARYLILLKYKINPQSIKELKEKGGT